MCFRGRRQHLNLARIAVERDEQREALRAPERAGDPSALQRFERVTVCLGQRHGPHSFGVVRKRCLDRHEVGTVRPEGSSDCIASMAGSREAQKSQERDGVFGAMRRVGRGRIEKYRPPRILNDCSGGVFQAIDLLSSKKRDYDERQSMHIYSRIPNRASHRTQLFRRRVGRLSESEYSQRRYGPC